MAPTGRAKTRAKARSTKKLRRTHYKKQLVKSKGNQGASTLGDWPSPPCTMSSSSDCSKIDGIDFEGVDTPTSACSTPKAQRFRIPEIVTCPPAPRKQRVVSNCSLGRTPIAFFAPPDLELFFFVALRDISV